MKPLVTLFTGGSRSGKSRLALEMAFSYQHPVFIATAEALDAEMQSRIERHRAERDERLVTLESPIDLAGTLERLPVGTDFAVIDCLTVWLSNLLCRDRLRSDGTAPEIEAFLACLSEAPCPLAIVTNEVGSGVVPPSPLGRTFRDAAGFLNQAVAARADSVCLVVCGLPLWLKGDGKPA